MTPPLLRVVVAGVPAARVHAWVTDLQTRLPPEVTCVPWPMQDSAKADRILLLGTDRADDAHREAESALRAALATQVSGYQVIRPPDTLQQALHAIGRALLPLAPSLAQPLMRAEVPPRWQGVCEGCGDPDCEYRLFSGLTHALPGNGESLQR